MEEQEAISRHVQANIWADTGRESRVVNVLQESHSPWSEDSVMETQTARFQPRTIYLVTHVEEYLNI